MNGRVVMVLAGVLDCLGLGWRELVGGRGFVRWLTPIARDASAREPASLLRVGQRLEILVDSLVQFGMAKSSGFSF